MVINLVKKYLNQQKNYLNEKSICKSLSNKFLEVPRTDILKGKCILFNTVRSFTNIFDTELFLGKIFALNGAKVYILIDDGVLNHWDSLKFDSLENLDFKKENLNPYTKHHHKKFAPQNQILKLRKKVFDDPYLQILPYSTLLNDPISTDLENENFFHHAKASTIRFFKNSDFDLNQNPYNRYFKLSLDNCKKTYTIAQKCLDRFKPDIFITSHGIYSLWGPMFDFFRSSKVKSYVYAGKHSHALNFKYIYFTDSRVQTLTRSSFWNHYKTTPVSTAMKEAVDNYFKIRFSHNTSDTKVYFGEDTTTLRVNSDPNIKYHIAIFPNSIWDGNIHDRHLAFSGIIDWLVKTITYFKDKPEYQIYLKFHPAEISFFQNPEGLADIIEKKIPNLNSLANITLIRPQEKVETYDFLKSGIDVAILYDGFLGLELPYMKIPAILAGVDGRFTVEGGNFTIRSEKEYFDYLGNIDQLINKFKQNYDTYLNNIYRYAYWYLFLHPFELATQSPKGRYQKSLKNLSMDDLQIPEKLLQILLLE
jgi:hypothetical protein